MTEHTDNVDYEEGRGNVRVTASGTVSIDFKEPAPRGVLGMELSPEMAYVLGAELQRAALTAAAMTVDIRELQVTES